MQPWLLHAHNAQMDRLALDGKLFRLNMHAGTVGPSTQRTRWAIPFHSSIDSAQPVDGKRGRLRTQRHIAANVLLSPYLLLPQLSHSLSHTHSALSIGFFSFRKSGRNIVTSQQMPMLPGLAAPLILVMCIQAYLPRQTLPCLFHHFVHEAGRTKLLAMPIHCVEHRSQCQLVHIHQSYVCIY